MTRNRAKLSTDEEARIWQLAGITGRPMGELARLVKRRSDLAQAQFQLAVMLATGEWDYLDQEAQWGPDPEQQAGYLRRYAARLVVMRCRRDLLLPASLADAPGLSTDADGRRCRPGRDP